MTGLPKGWTEVALGEVAVLIRGVTFKPADVAEVGEPATVAVLRTSNVQHQLDLSDVWAIPQELQRRKEQTLRPGDVLISSANSWNLVGKCSWVDELPWPATFGGFVTVLRVADHRLDPRYLYRWFSSGRVQSTVRSFGRQTTNISNLNLDRCRAMSMPLPPLEEQRRIAAILDKADELRVKRRAALEQLDSLTQAIFLDMFGDPVTELNRDNSVPLHELGSLDRGVSRHRPRNDPDLLGGPYPLVQTGDVARSGGYISSALHTYSEKGLAQSKLWPAGTLCITIAANIAKTGILTFDACFPDSVVGFVSDRPGMSEYVQAVLSFHRQRLEDLAPESAQKNINLKVLRDLEVPTPGEVDLERFHLAQEQLRREHALHARSASYLGDLGSSLQTRAFRGEL